ncbi:MAG: non-reducing end alpha-L-arabinofuranosidase family hydrolase [Armatimonadota bacterium]|nr:non-reducing end alpha-L-arabinofuranosidase family hydrolase [Armatimonadota bacterium]MDW8026272.1 non-reducing end alpha-L-arabinofuranosidase family hydrolase [Armatimonadota bacterium]
MVQIVTRMLHFGLPTTLTFVTICAIAYDSGDEQNISFGSILLGNFRWICSPPLISPMQRPDDFFYSVKDPSIVFYNGRWHLFCTVRGKKRSHQIEYISFTDFENAANAERHMLRITDGYFCAPQVFYFTPHKKWYLIFQIIDQTRKPALQPAYSTNDDIANPHGWTKPRLLFTEQPKNVERWIDFWVICDENSAHLFFTSLDGRMWRSETKLSSFPDGWSEPKVVLVGDIFEASHTYRLRGLNTYFTIIEAQGPNGRRYYKAYIAESLDGKWKAIADTYEKPFASPVNVQFFGENWTDSFSHGELIRAGYDERMEVDPASIRFLFQGVSDKERVGKSYGEIPWRLGLLTMLSK